MATSSGQNGIVITEYLVLVVQELNIVTNIGTTTDAFAQNQFIAICRCLPLAPTDRWPDLQLAGIYHTGGGGGVVQRGNQTAIVTVGHFVQPTRDFLHSVQT